MKERVYVGITKYSDLFTHLDCINSTVNVFRRLLNECTKILKEKDKLSN